jgi:4-amino-4-deoxy-L-arabinose transferase-like glycosyltransferase
MLFVLALLLVTVSFAWWKGLRTAPEEKVQRWEFAALAFLLAVAAAFRLHHLRTEPYGLWFDEAENILVTLRILHEPLSRPVFVAEAPKMPALTFYVFAPFVKVFGGTGFAVRLATTAVGLLSVVATWLLGRELFGRRIGLIAAALLAVSRWHVSFSRFGMAILFPTLFIPLVLFLYMRSQWLRSPRDAALAGASLGLGVQFYYSTVALPGVIVLTFLREALGRRKRRLAAAALLVVTLGIGALAYAPVWQFARRDPEHFAERFRAVSSLKAGSSVELQRLFLTPSPQRREAR